MKILLFQYCQQDCVKWKDVDDLIKTFKGLLKKYERKIINSRCSRKRKQKLLFKIITKELNLEDEICFLGESNNVQEFVYNCDFMI